MQVSVESGEGLQRRMKVELPAERINNAVENRLRSLARTVRIDGFRPGKVPLKVLRNRYGDQVRHEAYGDLVQSTFHEAAVKEQLRPAGEPRIEIKDEGDSFGYVAEFEIMPDVALADLSSSKVEREVAEVTDADVDNMIEKLRRQRTTWNAVERAAQDGDQLMLSFVGKIDGEPFDGGSADNVPLILGSGMMIEGFETGLLGASAGEQRTIEVSFPGDYRVESLAGKPAAFEVTVKEVQEPALPEVDGNFARELGVADGSVDSLRAEIRSNMERELKQKLRARLKESVMKLLVEAHDLQVPKVMVEAEAARMKQQTRDEMARSGQNSSVDLPIDLFRADAERRVKLGLLIGEIVKANEIRVDEQRMRKLAEDLASAYEDSQEVVKYYMTDRDARGGLENLTLEDQVVDWVLGAVEVDDKSVSFDSVM